MERRTSLSIKELLETAKTGGAPSGGCVPGMRFPVCFYVNEIGVAMNIGSDEEKIEAKEALMDLLSSGDSALSGTAFCFLFEAVSRECDDASLIEAVALFENDPRNKEIVICAKNTVARKRSS